MISVAICALTGAVLYLAIRWNLVRAENVTLRAQIAQLKRRLASRER